MNNLRSFYRGEVYRANLNPFSGVNSQDTIPVLVLQNNADVFYASTVIVAPITTYIWKYSDKLTYYVLSDEDFLKSGSMVMLGQIKTIDRKRIKKYLGELSEGQMREIKEMMELDMSICIPEDPEFP